MRKLLKLELKLWNKEKPNSKRNKKLLKLDSRRKSNSRKIESRLNKKH
jgi:hypothetical protein